ncbi:MAG: SDR family oxidoreductase [Alphaproteobacteria bacterium]
MQDNTRLTGKVAIVTGAGSRNPGAGATNIGNGRAIAVLMAARGAKVLLLDVDRAALEETAQMIAAEGGVCAIAEAEVSKADDCAAAVAEAACFLASPAARWITGQTLPVDAGSSAGNAAGASPKPAGALR